LRVPGGARRPESRARRPPAGGPRGRLVARPGPVGGPARRPADVAARLSRVVGLGPLPAQWTGPREGRAAVVPGRPPYAPRRPPHPRAPRFGPRRPARPPRTGPRPARRRQQRPAPRPVRPAPECGDRGTGDGTPARCVDPIARMARILKI